MSAPRRYAFINLGCNANQADAERIASKLRTSGEREAENTHTADTLVIMTCAFTKERQEESLRQIGQCFDHQKHVIVSGCLPDINPPSLHAFSGLKIIRPRDLNQSGGGEHKAPASAEEFCRIRVSRGCLGRCTFCAIPKATGPLSSKPKQEILAEVEQAVRLGHRRLMLSGEDVGAYGRDVGTSLGSLLKDILRSEAEFELRIESVNPHWLTLLLEEALSLLGDSRISQYWYVPVQAASDRLLKIMQRPYTVAEFESSIDLLRKQVPNLFLVTDLVVGHPGESVSDVISISGLFESTPVNYIEVMKFDSHEGIRAATLPGALSEEEKVRRVAYTIFRFVRYYLENRKFSLREVGLFPINTNVTSRDIFRAISESIVGEISMSYAGDSIDDLLADEVLSFGKDCAQIDRYIAEVCRRIGPPGPVNMPLGAS